MANSDVAVFERDDAATPPEGDGAATRPSQSIRPPGELIQAHLGRPSKFADGKTRDWTIFFFFRIMAKAEIEADATRLSKLLRLLIDNDVQRPRDFLDQVKLALFEIVESLKDPALVNAGLIKQKFAEWKVNQEASAGANGPASPVRSPLEWDQPPDAPTGLFRGLLKSASEASFAQLQSEWNEFLSAAIKQAAGPNEPDERRFSGLIREPRDGDDLREKIKSAIDIFRRESRKSATEQIRQVLSIFNNNQPVAPGLGAAAELALILKLLKATHYLFANPRLVAEQFENFGDSQGQAGLRALEGGLIGVCLYEFFRQLQPALLRAPPPDNGANQGTRPIPPIVRSEKQQYDFARATGLKWDPCPVNYVFTNSGLNALNLDQTTLASFPDAFKDGMAARAERLGDTGPSAPANWDGSLGLNDLDDPRSVHGYFTGGFQVADDHTPVKARLWDALREDILAFNQRSGRRGECLRLFMSFLFRLWGIEILQIELGQDPYKVHAGDVQRVSPRREHFGFADGISQPFVDLGFGRLGDPPPGGGTPGPNRTWASLAPGEIYLDQYDEDGNLAEQPISAALRAGATFIVFRKLEQQVPQFRTFLHVQRPKDPHAMQRLASEFVGRWPNGAPLVLAPDEDLDLGPRPKNVINDFLYAADDPKGEKCPLSAHIRRTNPRDIGGTNDVRRHRILRRAISFGGELLPESSLGDGKKRGMLFIAVNARIELQFEVIQARWINTGEFLGQAGLNRCPIAGANRGGPQDAFLEAGAVAPVVDLPRFVLTRGGDYFFAPGVEALKAIACGCTFPPDPDSVPYGGYSMGDTTTPSLFDPDRIEEYAESILAGTDPVIRVAMPPPNPAADPESDPVAFVGQHADVVKVMSTVADNAPLIYSVVPYRDAGRAISRGHDLIIGTEPGVGSKTALQHRKMHDILNAAWDLLNTPPGIVYGRLKIITKRGVDAALARTGPAGTIDLVNDLAATCVYGIVNELFGLSGPDFLTEIAVALPFFRQHIGELPADWLKSLKGGPPANQSLATLQTWSNLLVEDLLDNLQHEPEVTAVSEQAAGEFLEYLDIVVATVRANLAPVLYPRPSTLIEAFVANEVRFVGRRLLYPSPEKYYYDVTMLLMELTASATAFIPAAFGFVMSNVLDFGIDLHGLIPILLGVPKYSPGAPRDGVARLVYETCRLNPPVPILMRRCLRNDVLPSGGEVKRRDWVAAMVGAAGLDPRAFNNPQEFSLYPFLPGPVRNINDYLLFGVYRGGRECWGKDRIALFVLEECVKAAGRLQNLRKVTGPAGDLTSITEMAAGFDAHFDGVYRDWS